MSTSGGLAAWAEASGHLRATGPVGGGLRFAFYGRVSTEDWQDPVTSRVRQRGQAEALVRGHGRVVAEFFDEGESRSVAWGRRPQAAALVAQLADPGRNPHRPGTGWTLGTVTTILRNPRYTGQQVWNRQRTDKDLVDSADVSLGHKKVQRWNLPDGWVISKGPAYAAPARRAREAPVPPIRTAGLRRLRAADGVGVVQRQGRLPLPPRPHHR
jgi:hypothetical protein